MPSYLDSNQLNFIVFRYLQESGFTHAAFTLGYEAGINKSTVDGHQIPPAALVRLVQKGIQYMEMEANASNSEDDDEDYTFIEPWDLMTKNVDDLHKIVKEKKKLSKKEPDRERAKNKEPSHENELESGCDKERGTQEIKKKREVEKEKVEAEKVQTKEKERKKQLEEPMELEVKREKEDKMNIDESATFGAFEVMQTKSHKSNASKRFGRLPPKKPKP